MKAHLRRRHNKSGVSILDILASMRRERDRARRKHEAMGMPPKGNDSSSSNSDSDDDDNGACLDFFGEGGVGEGNPPTGAEVHAVPAEVTVEVRKKSWEETEREIVEKTMHIVLEKDMDDSEVCVICLDNLRKGQKLTILGCLCKFHEGCYKDYMASKPPNACPVHHKE